MSNDPLMSQGGTRVQDLWPGWTSQALETGCQTCQALEIGCQTSQALKQIVRLVRF